MLQRVPDRKIVRQEGRKEDICDYPKKTIPLCFLGSLTFVNYSLISSKLYLEYLTLLYLQQICEARTVILRKNLFHLLAPPPPFMQNVLFKTKVRFKISTKNSVTSKVPEACTKGIIQNTHPRHQISQLLPPHTIIKYPCRFRYFYSQE